MPRRSATQRTSHNTPARKKWSRKVTEQSDALDLKAGVFKLRSAHAIAGIAEEVSRSESASQVESFSLCDVHAQL